MRAKFIKEDLNFERGQDPKTSIGIGGIDLLKIYDDTVQKSIDEWKMFLKSLEGKKINFFNINLGKRETIKVHSIGQHYLFPDDIWFFDDATRPVKRVDPDLSQKIYIVDES